MSEFTQLPSEPTLKEREELFSLAATCEPGPFDDAFYEVARKVVPKLQRQILRLERENAAVGLVKPTEAESVEKKPAKSKK